VPVATGLLSGRDILTTLIFLITTGGQKAPHYIYLSDHSSMNFAGILERQTEGVAEATQKLQQITELPQYGTFSSKGDCFCLFLPFSRRFYP